LVLCRKELIKSTPTLLIIGAVIYLTRKLTSGARGQGVSVQLFINSVPEVLLIFSDIERLDVILTTALPGWLVTLLLVILQQ